MNFIKNHKLMVAVIAVVVVIIIFAVSIFGYVNSVRNEGIRKEAELTAQYKTSMTELSAYTQKIQESLGVAELGSDKVQEILVEAVKGRYDGNMEPGDTGSMFSAIQEAYPDLSATSETYAKIQTMVEVGRDSFKNKQNVMQSRIADYSVWQKSGLMKSVVVDTLGFPSDDLKVTIGDQVFKGEDALEKMEQVIVSTEALGDFESGVSDPLIEMKGD